MILSLAECPEISLFFVSKWHKIGTKHFSVPQRKGQVPGGVVSGSVIISLSQVSVNLVVL